jgi:ABC-type branched-subunit amino acid transport system substrate-binding protein
MRKAPISRAALIVAAMFGTVFNATAQDKPPIKLAHTVPLSGPVSAVAKLQAIAVDIGVADVNASGGINGSKLEILRYDDQLKPDQAVLRIRQAMAANAVGIIGPVSGTQWETASPLVNQLKFPAFNINANKPDITKRPWSLRVAVPDDTGIPEGFADFLRNYPNVKTVVVMGDVREASGKAAVDQWTKLAESKHMKVLGTIAFTTGTTDFSSAAIKIKELNPDAILISTVTSDAINIGRAFHEQGVSSPILGNSLMWPGVLPQTLAKTIGKDAALWHVTGSSTNEKSNGDPAVYKSFVSRYIAAALKDPIFAQYKPPNVANASLGYDVVLIIADMLRRKGVDGNTPILKARGLLKDAMMEIKQFKGANFIKFRDNGDAYIPMRALQIDPAKSEWQFQN